MSAAMYFCQLVFYNWSAISFGSGINLISASALSARNIPLIAGHVRFSFKKQVIGAERPPASLYKNTHSDDESLSSKHDW
jgi:hypothetical protein